MESQLLKMVLLTGDIDMNFYFNDNLFNTYTTT